MKNLVSKENVNLKQLVREKFRIYKHKKEQLFKTIALFYAFTGNDIFILFISFSFLARKRERNEPKKEKTRFCLPAASSSNLSRRRYLIDE